MTIACDILAMNNPLEHVVPHVLFTIPLGPYEMEFNNHLFMVLLSAVVMAIVLPLSVRQRTIIPHGLRNLIEAVCVFIREDMARPVLGEHTDKFIMYLWTTFFFILFCNLLGMVPTEAAFFMLSGGYIHRLGGAATANIWVTGTLACISFIMVHVSGVREQGLVSYFKNFIPKVPWPLAPLMYCVELIGAAVKPFALAIRLFANMLAGHTVLAALMIMVLMSRSLTLEGITIIASAIFSLLELFVAFLQAYIFTFLTTMFIAAAVHPEH